MSHTPAIYNAYILNHVLFFDSVAASNRALYMFGIPSEPVAERVCIQKNGTTHAWCGMVLVGIFSVFVIPSLVAMEDDVAVQRTRCVASRISNRRHLSRGRQQKIALHMLLVGAPLII